MKRIAENKYKDDITGMIFTIPDRYVQNFDLYENDIWDIVEEELGGFYIRIMEGLTVLGEIK